MRSPFPAQTITAPSVLLLFDDFIQSLRLVFGRFFVKILYGKLDGRAAEPHFHYVVDFQNVSGFYGATVHVDLARVAGFRRDRATFDYSRYFQKLVDPHTLHIISPPQTNCNFLHGFVSICFCAVVLAIFVVRLVFPLRYFGSGSWFVCGS